MATQEDLAKLETLFQGQIYNQIATYPGFDPSKLETQYLGEMFYAVGPEGSVEPPDEPAFDASRMFVIF